MRGTLRIFPYNALWDEHMPECRHGNDLFSATPCPECVYDLEITGAVIPDFLSRNIGRWSEGAQLDRKRTTALAKMSDVPTLSDKEPSCRRLYPLTAHDQKVIAELTEYHNHSVKEKTYERLAKAGFV